MSDQYTPPRPGAARDEYNRTNVHIQPPVERPVPPGGGFGTGMLVAAVFVVLAIFAFVLFGQRDTAGPVPATPPNVSIENTNVPDAMPAPGPDVTPVEPVPAPGIAPDTGTVDPVAPAPDAAPVEP